MLEPEFSESQLQTATNLSYAVEICKRTGQIPFPFIPSLPAEFLLGWDTAFKFDWIAHRRLPTRFLRRHKGCNFFLQYKLSDFAEIKNRSKEWAAWNNPYYRFRIPHRKVHGTRYRNDFHQWDRLKEIACLGVPTFYATNTMSTEDELKSLFESGTLLSRIALLDIASINKKHIYASFSSSSNSFLLHSDPEEARLLTFSSLLDDLNDARSRSFEEGVEELTAIARNLSAEDGPSDTGGIVKQLNDFQERYLSFIGQDGLPFLKRQILEDFFLRRFGIKAYWHPTRP